MNKIPIFVSDHSIGDSILTISKNIWVTHEEEKDGKKVIIETSEPNVADGSPISIFAIAKKHNLSSVVLVDSSMSSFWEAYQNSKKFKIQLIYGVKIVVCEKLTAKDDDSRLTESSIILFAKNSQGYHDLLPIYSQATVEGFYYQPRTDWASLVEKWTPNLQLAFPFYSSFLARNLMKYGNRSMPDYSKLGKPIFFAEEHGLPFDKLIGDSLANYAQRESIEISPAHTCYYYRESDAQAYQTLRCIKNNTTAFKPNLDHFGTSSFSFEELL